MRIHSIEAIPIEIPLKKNFGGSTYSVLTRCTVITRMRIKTQEGAARMVACALVTQSISRRLDQSDQRGHPRGAIVRRREPRARGLGRPGGLPARRSGQWPG